MFVAGSSGESRFTLQNRTLQPESDEEVDEPTNWVDHDAAERTERDARLEELDRTEQLCNEVSTEANPFYFLRAWINEERAAINAGVYAPE